MKYHVGSEPDVLCILKEKASWWISPLCHVLLISHVCGAWAKCKNLTSCGSVAKYVLCIFVVVNLPISSAVLCDPPSVQMTCVM